MTDITPSRTFCWGVLHAIGMFDVATLTDEEKLDCAGEKAWFGFGEVVMAGMMALTLTVPAGLWFASLTELPLAFIGAGLLFLPLFVFLPRLIRYGMKADTDAVLDALGRNEQARKVFWALFAATAGLVLAQVAEPAAAEQIATLIAGIVP